MEENMASTETQQPSQEAFHELKNPDFDAGNFVMWLASNPQGFTLQTDKSLPRKDFPLPLTPDQRSTLVFGMGEEMKFTGGTKAAEALAQLRAGKISQNDYENARKEYVEQGNKPKVGIRNIRRNGDAIVVDIKPVSYPVLSNFANAEAGRDLKNFSEGAATSMTIITADNKILIQHRGIANALYPDMPGTSVAGVFDGVFKRPSPDRLHYESKGTLEHITEKSVLVNIKKESVEEIGIEEGDFSSIILAGLSEEMHPVLHHEFLFKAKTKLTSEQIKKKALNTSRARKKELKPEDIEEKFDFIDATPEAIFDLLTKVKCPIPPTHIAVFAATGYDLVLEAKGKSEADEYKSRLEKGIKDNVASINQLVKKYYQENPQKLTEIPQRMMAKVNDAVEKFKAKNPSATDDDIVKFKTETIQKLPKKDPNGYAPAFTPTEQGLPDYDSALKQAGLI